MADNLSLLFRLKAENQASPAIKAAQADVAKLRGSFGSDLNQMQGVATSALGKITQSLTQVTGQIPIVGTAVNGLSSQFSTMASASTGAAAGLGVMAGAAVIGVAALGGLIALAINAAKGIFQLAQSTSDYGSRIFDAQQKSNFLAETLSVLDVIQRRNGGTLDALILSLGIFQSNMVKAAEGGNEMSKTFKALNIDTTNQERAFRQAIKALADMGQTERQTAEAKKLFGRAGQAVLAVVKDTNGNLDEAIAKYEEMGLIISGPAAAAADAFGDTLLDLQDRFSALGRTIGFEVIPVLTVFMEDLATVLTGSKENWKDWADFIKVEVALALGAVQGFVQYVASRGTLSLTVAIDSATQGLLARAAESQATLTAFAATQRVANLAGGGGGGGTGGGGKAKAQQDEIYKAQLEASKQAAAKELETQRHLSESLKLAYEEQRVSLEQFFAGRQTLIDEHFNALIDAINREQQALDEARARGRIKIEEANKKDAELTQRTTEATNRLHEETRKLKLEKQKTLDKAELDLERQLSEIRAARREGELNRIKDDLERNVITESEALSRRLAIYKEEHQERMLLLELERAQLSTTADKKLELDNKKIESEQRFTDETKRLTEERIQARDREAAITAPGAKGFVPLSEDAISRAAGAVANAAAGIPPAISLWDQLTDAIGRTMGQMMEFNDFAVFSVKNAFADMADAVRGSVLAWALYGESIGKALKKALASILAQIAAEATIQALLHAAYAIGRAAFGDFGGAAKHALAALKFGAVAAAAGIGAKVVAGGAFNSSGTTSGSSSGSSDTSRSNGSLQPKVVDTDRRSYIQPIVHVHVEGQATEGFKYMVTKAVVEDYRSGGDVRDVIGHAIGLPGFKG